MKINSMLLVVAPFFMICPILALEVPLNIYETPEDNYLIKSAQIVYETSPESKRIYTFDEYGQWEYQEDISYQLENGKRVPLMHFLKVRDGATTILVNLLDKSGEKLKTEPGESVSNGGMDLGRQSLYNTFAQMKATKLPSEKVLGRMSDVYAFDDASWGYQAKFWIWNKIILKAVISGHEANPSEVNEKPTITKATYKLPVGISFTEK